MFAVQVLGEEIAKGVTHDASLSLRKSQQSANDLRRNWGCYSQRNGAMLVAGWFNQLAGRLRKREPIGQQQIRRSALKRSTSLLPGNEPFLFNHTALKNSSIKNEKYAGER